MSWTEASTSNSPTSCAPERKKLRQDTDVNVSKSIAESLVIQSEAPEKVKTVYGMLVLLGYNGKIPNGHHVRQKSSYTLLKKKNFSGVKPYKWHISGSIAGQQAMQSIPTPTVIYDVGRMGRSVVVEYRKDENSDMFQIGRSSDSKIDFVVLDTIPGPKQPDTVPEIQNSTISRYACRITVDRNPPYTARVFAAGFDKTNNIFLGEKAAKWQNGDETMDGLTTNGILHMNPKGGPNCPASIWREISVCGNVYGLRETRATAVRGEPMANESNILMDGSLIDLCGAVLMWRTSEGMKEIPTEEMMDVMGQHLNASRPQCPVGLTTLVFPTSSQSTQTRTLDQQPHMYIKCGHVHGFHEWSGRQDDSTDKKSRTCPICLQASKYVPLQIGNERAFYKGEVVPTHAFVPCGHVCSEATVRFWSQIPIPKGCDAFQAICPFCALPLESVDGFVKLIFSTEN